MFYLIWFCLTFLYIWIFLFYSINLLFSWKKLNICVQHQQRFVLWNIIAFLIWSFSAGMWNSWAMFISLLMWLLYDFWLKMYLMTWLNMVKIWRMFNLKIVLISNPNTYLLFALLNLFYLSLLWKQNNSIFGIWNLHGYFRNCLTQF